MNSFRFAGAGYLFAVSMMFSIPALAADEEKTLTLDSRGLQSMRVDTGAGFLHIQGVEGAEEIEVVADIFADRSSYRLSLEKRGDTAVLTSEAEWWSFLSSGEWGRIDLTVKVPSWLALDINDGSGEIEVSGMKAAAEIRDGSGSILVKSHRGNLDIHDGSGSIDVQGVNGKVRIEDGSGSQSVVNIVGDVDIRDGSGSIKVKNVDGHVTIRDGSGGIDVATVKRGLTIRESGSGGVSTSDIQGGLDIDD